TDRITIEALYAYFEFVDNKGGSYDGNLTSSKDKIGDEIDISIRYRATDNLYFRLATGWLLDAEGLGTTSDVNLTLFQAVMQF
ncbi:MAG: hypothetical protein V3T77_03025, partial [Planctomycetota bacterium]